MQRVGSALRGGRRAGRPRWRVAGGMNTGPAGSPRSATSRSLSARTLTVTCQTATAGAVSACTFDPRQGCAPSSCGPGAEESSWPRA